MTGPHGPQCSGRPWPRRPRLPIRPPADSPYRSPESVDARLVRIELPVELRVAAAVARKVQQVQQIEGQAAIDLINAAGVPAPGADGRGALVNTRA